MLPKYEYNNDLGVPWTYRSNFNFQFSTLNFTGKWISVQYTGVNHSALSFQGFLVPKVYVLHIKSCNGYWASIFPPLPAKSWLKPTNRRTSIEFPSAPALLLRPKNTPKKIRRLVGVLRRLVGVLRSFKNWYFLLIVCSGFSNPQNSELGHKSILRNGSFGFLH